YTNNKLSSNFYAVFARILAKVTAFMEPPMSTLIKYPASDKSLPARYARSIAYYRNKQVDRSMDLLDGLIREFPNDPYFYELKGQILFEDGNPLEAYYAYEKAVNLAPQSGLIRLSYVQALLETTGDSELDRMIQELHRVLKQESENPLAWHLLAIAFGKKDMVG